MSDAAALDVAGLALRIASDPASVLPELRDAAAAGRNDARLVLAQMLIDGKGVDRDEAEAVHLYALAANDGHAMAMNLLGRCHELGRGTRMDPVLAVAWYRRAAETGLDWGMYNLANALATGKGIARDRAAAYRWYRHAAELGHAKSMNLVGRHFEEGWDVERNVATALQWYRRSALGGDFRGQASYAAVLADAGRLDEAEHWIRLAIAAGTPSFHAHMARVLPVSPHARLRVLAERLPAGARAPARTDGDVLAERPR